MTKNLIKIFNLFNVKFDQMQVKINSELEELQNNYNVLEIKTIGDSLNKCTVFVIHE